MCGKLAFSVGVEIEGKAVFIGFGACRAWVGMIVGCGVG